MLIIIEKALSPKSEGDHDTSQTDKPSSGNIDVISTAIDVIGNIQLFKAEKKKTFRLEVSGICVNKLTCFPSQIVSVCNPLISLSFTLNHGKP